MARFLKLTGVTVTDPAAPFIPWPIGKSGWAHRWDASLLTAAAGTNVLTLPDSIGTRTLTAPASGSRTLKDAAGYRYLTIGAGLSLGFADTAGANLTTGFTVATAARYGAGYGQIAKVGGYFIEFGGNGKINVYSNNGSAVQWSSGVSNGTGWHTIVATLDGANTRVTIDGVHLAAATLPTPTVFAATVLGNNLNALDAVFLAVHPSKMTDAERLAVHAGIAAKMGL